MPDVSVLMPYRDAAHTLEEALDSVLGQTGVHLEVCIVDDGSQDSGPDIVRRLAAQHAGLRPSKTGGVGIARALNHAAKMAEAPYFARMDADDIAKPQRLAMQLDVLRRRPELAVLGSQVEAFPEANVQDGLRHYVAWQNRLLTPEQHRQQIFVESPLCHPSVVFRRTAFEQVGGYRAGHFPEDYELWLRLDAAGYTLAKLDKILLRWRHHASQATLTDPRYARARFIETKAPYLAMRLRAKARPVDVWGAGQTGKRIARSLEPYGVRAARFIDIDPRKINGQARGAPIVGPDALLPPGKHTVVIAVGARGARDLVRQELHTRGYREGEDYLAAS